MPSENSATLNNKMISGSNGNRKIYQISAFLLFCLLHYWHIVESYTVTPESRINPDKSLNWFGSIVFAFWAAAPLVAWCLFLWVLVTSLNQSALLHSQNTSVRASTSYKPLVASTVTVALTASFLFGLARLALDVFEINHYAGQFHMDATYHEAIARFASVLTVYVATTLFIVYRDFGNITFAKAIRSALTALCIIYGSVYIFYFIGQCIILDTAWWFPMPDGHGWSDSQIDLANKFSLVTEWLPNMVSLIFTLTILRRLKKKFKG